MSAPLQSPDPKVVSYLEDREHLIFARREDDTYARPMFSVLGLHTESDYTHVNSADYQEGFQVDQPDGERYCVRCCSIDGEYGENFGFRMPVDLPPDVLKAGFTREGLLAYDGLMNNPLNRFLDCTSA